MVQWLGLGTLTAGAVGSIPGWGNKTPQAVRREKEKKKAGAKMEYDFFFVKRTKFS